MKAVLRFIAAHNFITIASCFTCYVFFSTLNNPKADFFFAFGVSFSCWLFYWLDKMLDNRNRTFRKEDRHYLSNTDRKIQWLTGGILLSLMLFNFHTIRLTTFLLITLAVTISLLYFKSLIIFNGIVKTLFSSLIITATICVMPAALDGRFQNPTVVIVFFMMVFGNMTLLTITDKDYDHQYSFNAMSKHLSEKMLIKLLITVLFILIFFGILIENIKLRTWIGAYCILYSMLLIFRKKTDANLQHILSDAIFLIPLL